MTYEAVNVLFAGSLLLFASVIAVKAGTKFGIPVLLLFLGVGMFFGSDGLGIQFNSPRIAQFIGMIALSIILFSGGMDTKFSEVKPILAPGLILSTIGVMLTAAITGGFIYLISNTFSLMESMLLGAVLSSTDSASVFSILRAKRQGLKQRLRPLLEFESGSNDPMAYMLTIILIQVITSDSVTFTQALSTFAIQMSVGAACGYIMGKGALYVINRVNISNASFYPILLLAFVLFIYSSTDLLHGNGYLSVYVAGLVIGNHKIAHKRSLTTFFDGFAWLFQIVMFITLGLLVNPHELLPVAVIGLLIGLFMILVSRPLTVFLCMAPFRRFTTRGRLYVSWVGLRGAVPIVFATYPMLAGIDNANMIFNIVFFITIVSLSIQGTTVGVMAKLMRLSTEEHTEAFGIDLPDKIKAALSQIDVEPVLLKNGDILRELTLPGGTLIVMIKRDDGYFVPKGDTKLMVGDKLLVISDNDTELHKEYKSLGIINPIGRQ